MRVATLLRCFSAAAPVVLCCGVAAWAQQNPDGQLNVAAFPQPYLLLVRDPVVHEQLQLSEAQRNKIRAACDRIDPQFWRLRGQTPQQAAEGLRQMTAAMEREVVAVLDKQQRQRLAQIQMQLAGMKVFQREEVVETLRLSDSQQSSIGLALETFQQGYEALLERSQQGEDAEKLNGEAARLRGQLRDKMSEILTNPQKQAWRLMVGERIDASQLGRVKFKAPSLEGAEPWINSPPLGDQQLRGRVVALHFWAFRCINCQRNLPWYKDWHAELADQGAVVLGIHTPELASEKSVDALRTNVQSQGLEYPIVVDNDKRLWGLWGNTMWPTTYLIDKQGYVRYWWLGELNWKDAGAQQVFKTRIAELLAE